MPDSNKAKKNLSEPATSIQPTLLLRPIGVLRNSRGVKFDAPSQPRDCPQEEAVVELFPERGFERALEDLAGFERIWIVWWFHRNSNWRPMVRPPRGDGKRKGVFATRSPHRPNPLGISVVRLLGIHKLHLLIGANDLLDGTPILDIKPYISSVDSFPCSKAGWLDALEPLHAPQQRYRITLSTRAEEQLRWLSDEWGVEILERATEILSVDPFPHRTRRIKRQRNGTFRMGCGAWRLWFIVNGNNLTILRIAPGFPATLRAAPGYEEIPHLEAQSAFAARWPEHDPSDGESS